MASLVIHVDAGTLPQWATLGVVALGVLVAWRQLGQAAAAQRDQAVAQQQQAIMGIYAKWGEKRLEVARKLANSYGNSKALCDRLEVLEETAVTDEYYELTRIPDFFEELGLYVVKDEMIDLEIIQETFAYSVKYYWCLYEPFITSTQTEKDGMPDAYVWFRQLNAKLNPQGGEG